MGLVKVATTWAEFSEDDSCDGLGAYSEYDGDGQNEVIPSEDRHETPKEVPLLRDLERIERLWDTGETKHGSKSTRHQLGTIS